MFYRWLAYRTFRMQTMRNWEHSLGEKVQKSVQNCVISVQKSYFLTKFFWGQAPRLPTGEGHSPSQTPPLPSSNYPPPTFQQAPTPLCTYMYVLWAQIVTVLAGTLSPTSFSIYSLTRLATELVKLCLIHLRTPRCYTNASLLLLGYLG